MAEVAGGSRDGIEHMRSLETEPSWPGNSHWFPHMGWNVETVGTIESVHAGMDLKGGLGLMAPPLLSRMLTPGWAFDPIPASVLPLLGPEFC